MHVDYVLATRQCDEREGCGRYRSYEAGLVGRPCRMWGAPSSSPEGPGVTHQSPSPPEGTDEGPQSPQQVGLDEEEQGEVDAP